MGILKLGAHSRLGSYSLQTMYSADHAACRQCSLQTIHSALQTIQYADYSIFSPYSLQTTQSAVHTIYRPYNLQTIQSADHEICRPQTFWSVSSVLQAVGLGISFPPSPDRRSRLTLINGRNLITTGESTYWRKQITVKNHETYIGHLVLCFGSGETKHRSQRKRRYRVAPNKIKVNPDQRTRPNYNW